MHHRPRSITRIGCLLAAVALAMALRPSAARERRALASVAPIVAPVIEGGPPRADLSPQLCVESRTRAMTLPGWSDPRHLPDLDVCNAAIPFPAKLGQPLDPPLSGLRRLKLSDGYWVSPCNGPFCGTGNGGVWLRGLAWVDLDRDGQDELLLSIGASYGGNYSSVFLFLYEPERGQLRFQAELIPARTSTNGLEQTVDRIEPVGRHCLRLSGSCEADFPWFDGVRYHQVWGMARARFRLLQSAVAELPASAVDGPAPARSWTDAAGLRSCR